MWVLHRSIVVDKKEVTARLAFGFTLAIQSVYIYQ